jgi:bifunctional non-homologous end joining protein LigD
VGVPEFAKGIPSKETVHEIPHVTSPRVWEFGVHRHEAEKRGLHFDLRLGDPKTGHAHSWALHPELPAPGASTWAIQQPTHTLKYMDWEGQIPKGEYGAGKVELHSRERTEVVNAKPGHVNFNLYTSKGPQEFSLHQITGQHWILSNRTLHREKHPSLPVSKPDYKEMSVDKIDYQNPDQVLSAKIDGAHNLVYMPEAGKPIKIVSYRQGKKAETGVIDHTHKIPSVHGVATPAGFGGTILRTEVYALHPKTGKATPPETISGMLNTNVWESREKQKEHGELIPALIDVVQYRGRNMENAPFKEKLEVLRRVEKELPDSFHLPRFATTPEAKKALVKEIKMGKVPETKEGVVVWNLNEEGRPTKAKFVKEHDVYVRDFFPGEGKYKGKGVGGFLFSHSAKGPIVGRVGTGISDAQRADMLRRPELYVGTVARVKAQDKYPSGALRAPAFLNWHLDKNEPETLAMLKHGSEELELVFLWGDATS